MKIILSKATILLPLLFVYYSFTEPLTFCVPEIGLFLSPAISKFLIVTITVIWFACSSFRKSCCNGTWTEVLFNLVPIESILMLSFAQWHFFAALVTTILVIVSGSVLFVALRKDENKHKITKKRRNMYKTVFHRGFVFALFTICCIPCLVSLLSCGLQSPIYMAEQEIWNRLFSESATKAEIDNNVSDNYQSNIDFWNCFKPDKWNHWSLSEKITIAQRLVDFESDILGIPSIPIKADMIGDYTLGAFNNEQNEMWINTEHLANSSAEDCIRTICHESYHSLQYYLVNSLDWNNKALQTPYFSELQAWQQNQRDYKDAWVYGFDEYENQPLEIAARQYAEIETQRIMDYIKP